MVEPHLFVLEKASYTYKNTVIQKTGQPTHLAVICSVPLIPMARIIKRKPLRHNLLFHGVLCLERSERNGYKNGELLDLTAGEYKLLCLFMQNPGTVLSKEQILENLWDNEGNYIDNNTLNVYIRRLRTKVEDNPSDPQMILTVRRMGYKWNII